MQERHITTPGPVLDEHGVITPGYSERSICTYRRADIKAPFYRIKEWDFYQVSDGEKCLQFTYGLLCGPGSGDAVQLQNG